MRVFNKKNNRNVITDNNKNEDNNKNKSKIDKNGNRFIKYYSPSS